MRGGLTIFLLIALAGCAARPMLPAATIVAPRLQVVTVNPIGKWTAIAIDGIVLSDEDRFMVLFTPSNLRAVACNTFDGGYRLDGNRIVRTGPWRHTERGCFDPTGKRDVMATEERAFAILSSPLTVSTPAPNTLRLQGTRGTIDLVRRR